MTVITEYSKGVPLPSGTRQPAVAQIPRQIAQALPETTLNLGRVGGGIFRGE